MKQSKIEIIRHSTAHILAVAVQELFKGVKFGIGPAIENGFYYDFDLPRSLTPEDLPKIEKEMKEIIKKNFKFEKKELAFDEAIKLFKKLNQPLKIELINELKEKAKDSKQKVLHVTCYMLHEFTDLCSGPHVKSTKEINPDAFKLTKIAGAYWRGDEKNKMLTRIYGVAFETKKKLNEYIKKVEEAEKRDHRKLNEVLDLYQISDEVGAGLVIWHPKGAIIRNIIEDFWKKEHEKRDYHYVFSPHIGKIGLWEKSGHTEFYKEDMYSPMKIDEVKYQIKPMNCPFHVQVYKSQMRSYKDLPIRYCELGTVYRYEKTGVLHGLLRVRGFTQDDAHIFCQSDQLNDKIQKVIDLAIFMLNTFGFKEFEVDLSLRDPKNKSKYLGPELIWQKAEKALAYALEKKKLKYQRALGEAVFYGPKIDIKLKDSLGRLWQGITIQVDFNFPEKFDLNYINDKGKKQRVVMIHHTILGSMERFVGCLLEHYAGALPLWLSPEQIWIIPVGSRHEKYAQEVGERFREVADFLARRSISVGGSLRYQVKDENETVSKKIREGELQKIPYMLVVGDKEEKSKSVRVRDREKGDVGEMKLEKFIEKVIKEIENKS